MAEEHEHHHKHIKHRPVLRKISLFTTLILIFTSILLLVRLIQTNIVPTKYLIAGGVIFFIIDLIFLTISLIRRYHVWKTINIVLAVLLSAVFIFVGIVVKKSSDSISQLFKYKEITVTYYVMVNKPTNYYKLEDLKDKNVGMMVTNKNKIEEHLKDYQMKYNTYNSVGELIYSMEEANDAIVISKDFYEYINEEDTNLVLNLRKISEFDVVISSAEIKKQAVESTIDTNNSFIVYLIGVDASNTLNDVNILIVVNPDTHKILLVHVPRDYYVQIDGTTGLKEKLTHAGFYDMSQQINTMSSIFNLEMNAYVRVGFKAVTTIVDDIGGIDVYSDTAFNTQYGWINKGNNHLNGNKALAFSRQRKIYAGGDRHRGQNQEAVLTAVIKKISTNKNLLLKYDDLLNDLSPYLITNINLEDAQAMIKKQINDMPTWSVESISVNGANSENYTASYPRQWTYVMIPDQATIDEARSKIMAVMRGA